MRRQGHVRDESANVFNKVIRGSVVAPVADNEAKLGQTKTGAESAPARREIRMRDLWRIGRLGPVRRGALTLVAYAGTTEPGRDRLHVAVAEIHEILIPSGAKPLRPLDAREGRRLAETVRVLAADRERLLDSRRHP